MGGRTIKPKLIAFEGVDKVGKTTLRRGSLLKETNYGPLMMDRFLGGNFAYDMYHKRDHHIQNYDYVEKALMKAFDCVLVYLTCDYDKIQARIEYFREEQIPKEFLLGVDFWFYFYYKHSNFRKMILDTSHIDEEDAAQKILSFVNGMACCVFESNMSESWFDMMNAVKKPFCEYEIARRIFYGEIR